MSKRIKWMMLAGITLSIASVTGCKDSKPDATATVNTDTVKNIKQLTEDISGSFSDQTTLTFDSVQLTDFFIKYPLLEPYRDEVKQLYIKRNFAYAWYDNKGLIEPAGILYTRIRNLTEEGITAKVPYVDNLDSLMSNGENTDQQQRIQTELLLSGMYFNFANKVWDGFHENETQKMEWYLPRKKISYVHLLDSLVRTKEAFSPGNEPISRQYPLLKSYLKKYQELDNLKQWKQIVTSKKSFKPGDSSEVIAQIKNNLFLTGDLHQHDKNNLFDSSLQKAVKSFQHRFGLKEDGIVGASMIRELNVPVQKRIENIMVNMERSRWLPIGVTGEYLAVNIPEFKLHVYKDDSLQWSMNVVVGKSVNKTVIFSGRLQHVVFSPYWNVPGSIYKNEVLPGIKRNKNYLASHHMEKITGGVRQLPGPWNSLGQVKFLFPNSHSIYLHDTPSKSLFQEDKRAFSHGCIRLAEPKKLAAFLLRNDASWTDAKITEAMKSGKEKYVTLKDQPPVFITYFTTFVDREGNLNFRDDIYDRDERLIKDILTAPSGK